MPIPDSHFRIAIVGASTPRGKDLRELLEERGFRGGQIRLFDEDIAVGTITRSGDEAAIIAAVDEASFSDANVACFAGPAEMARRHAAEALRAGARVVDLSEDPGLDDSTAWIPSLDSIAGRPVGVERGVLRSPSAAAIVSASVAAALDRFRPNRLVTVFLRPVSECGQQGIDELEQQTTRLLSFQPVSGGIYDSQVAFNLMDAYGAASTQPLDGVRRAILRDIERALGGKIATPALWLLQAPVFFSYAFTIYAELGAGAGKAEIEAALAAAGFDVRGAEADRPTNLSVAGQPRAALGEIVPDGAREGAFWLWGAADNVRLVAANAVSIIESLV